MLLQTDKGNFTGEYLVTEYDLDMKFLVGARGLTSGFTAQTAMTDSNPQAIDVAASDQRNGYERIDRCLRKPDGY